VKLRYAIPVILLAAMLMLLVGCGKGKKVEPIQEPPPPPVIEEKVEPPPPAEEPKVAPLSLTTIYFDYDKSDIRTDARDALARTAEFLRSHTEIRVVIEGHCDERGSTEYNLGLGERRAQAVRQFMISLGVSAERMDTVSLGKERPFCTQSSEDCWQQNRRGHIVMAR